MAGSNFFQNAIKGDTAAGVEVELLSEGGFRMNYALLKKKKSNLDIVSTGFEVKDIDALKSAIVTSMPLCLAVTGKGVISKRASLSESENENSLLHKVLPNADPEDFYIQRIALENNQAVISVVRRATADELISHFKNAGYFTVNLSFGPFALTGILPSLNFSGEGVININGHILYLRHGGLSDYSYEKKNSISTIDVGGERTDERCAVALATASAYFVSEEANALTPEISVQRQEFRHKRIFRMAGWTALVLFFSSLMLNFLLFSHYNSRAQELNARVFKSRDELTSIAAMQNELQQKQKFLDRMGLLESSRTSYYADRIASDLPGKIQLSEMFVYPVEKNINAGKKEMSFIPGIIRISGYCKKSAELNDWVKLLKEKDWVKSVNVLNYSQENPSEPGSFQLTVSTR